MYLHSLTLSLSLSLFLSFSLSLSLSLSLFLSLTFSLSLYLSLCPGPHRIYTLVNAPIFIPSIITTFIGIVCCLAMASFPFLVKYLRFDKERLKYFYFILGSHDGTKVNAGGELLFMQCTHTAVCSQFSEHSAVYYLSRTVCTVHCALYTRYIVHYTLYTTTSTSWRRRGLKMVLRSDLDKLIRRAFLSTWVGTILHYEYDSCKL